MKLHHGECRWKKYQRWKRISFYYESLKDSYMNQKLNCIMLIDDDEPTNFLNSMIIEEAGCTNHLQIEDSGQRAINYLVNSEKCAHGNKKYLWPDLIFVDINMPAMNGWEFLDQLKSLNIESLRRIQVFIVSGTISPTDVKKSLSDPFVTNYFHKPIGLDTLRSIFEAERSR